jgi:integrase
VAALKLTDGEVEKAVAAAAEYHLWDTTVRRLGVRVTPSGSKIYLVQYRAKAAPGKVSPTRRIRIGKHDGEVWNVAKARAAARKLLARVDLGGDPFAEDERARRDAEAADLAAAKEAEARERDRFELVAERYIETCMKTNRSGDETARLLRHDAVPAWKGRPVTELRRADVAELLDGIKRRSPAVARATYAALRGLFGWCLERDLIESSPCDRITAPPRPEARDRVLADDELQLIWKASDGLGFPFANVVKLLMLTGQRRAEVAGMAWAEVDLEAGIWRIPKERTKNAKAHELDLSPQAVALLRDLKPEGPFVFPARAAPKRKSAAPVKAPPQPEGGVRGFSAVKRRLDELIEDERREAKLEGPMTPWRLHDLRRTAATGMAGMGIAPHVVERVLNHISGAQGGLVGVYQRHDYRGERKTALTAWGARVEAIVTAQPKPSNVHVLRA